MDFPSLRTAGDGLAGIKNKVVNAARGLRMPGVGAPEPVPVAPSAAAAPAAPTAAPLPQIDPAMAPQAQGMRSPTAAPAPAADIFGAPQPGTTPRSGVGGGTGEGFTYGSETPGAKPAMANPNVGAAGSAEKAAFDAARAAAPGVGPIHTVENLKPYANGMRNLGTAAEIAGKVAAVPGAALAGVQAYQDFKAGDNAMGGLHATDAAASAALLSPAAPVAGAYLGGRLIGDGVNALLPDRAKDAIGSAVNTGLRGVGGILGQHWGIDDSALKAQPQPVTAAAQPTAKTAAAVTATPAAAEPDDITAFNKRMVDVGAPTVGMRMGVDGEGQATRVLGNVGPASADAQAAQAQNNSMRTAQMAQATADNGRLAERAAAKAELAQISGSKFEDSDLGNRLAQQMDQARQPRIGASPVAPAAVLAAQQAQGAQAFEAQKTARMQGITTMRGQDVTSDDARLTQQTALINGMRQQQNADRTYGLEANRQKFDQNKQLTEERSKADGVMKDRLATMFTTTDKDGKTVPDAARVGEATQKINQELAERIKEARAVPKSNPGHAKAQQIADEMESKGLAALAPDDHDRLISQLAVRDRVKQAHGTFTPGSASFVDSRLGDYAVDKTESNLIGSDTLHLRNGGSVRAADVRYTDPASAFYNGMKIPTTDFDAGLGMRKGNK